MKLEHEFTAVQNRDFIYFTSKLVKSNQNVPTKDKHIHYTFPVVEEFNFTSVQ